MGSVRLGLAGFAGFLCPCPASNNSPQISAPIPAPAAATTPSPRPGSRPNGFVDASSEPYVRAQRDRSLGVCVLCVCLGNRI
jgi:hypothetical protein